MTPEPDRGWTSPLPAPLADSFARRHTTDTEYRKHTVPQTGMIEVQGRPQKQHINPAERLDKGPKDRDNPEVQRMANSTTHQIQQQAFPVIAHQALASV